MSNPEIAFHRYFGRLTGSDRDRYRGRLDLDQFDPRELSTALEQIRDEINSRFDANVKSIRSPDGAATLYMDYVDSEVKNALAFQNEGIYFIGITAAMLKQFVATCSTLWRLNPLADLLGVKFDQADRDFLFQTILLLQIQFIADHELGHMFHGHCEQLASGNFYEEFASQAQDAVAQPDRLRDQAYEVEADGYAVEMMLNGLFNDNVGQFIIERLKPSIDQREFILLLYILSVGSLLYWLPAATFDPARIRESSHPRGIARMNIVMRDIWRWCGENNPELIQFVSLERFQWVMACVQAAADDAEQQTIWLAQGTFLRSDEGQKYLDALYAERRLLRDEMNSLHWKKIAS
jgi:hypothetical protein